MNVLSIQNPLPRNRGATLSSARIKHLAPAEIPPLVPLADVALAIQATVTVLQGLTEQIARLEKAVKTRVALKPAFQHLRTVNGIGETLALTIMLEMGGIRWFPTVGQFASYCRCVRRTKLSNGKRKGRGNTKNGNKYLAWAFVEAAHFAVQWDPQVRRFYEPKKAKTHALVAHKAWAHKLARACYHMLRDQIPFDVHKAFAAYATLGVGWGTRKRGWGTTHELLIGRHSNPPLLGYPENGGGAEPPLLRATLGLGPIGNHEICDFHTWM